MSKNIIEEALMYAVLAHSGQVRKGNPKEPAIVHPIAVADILRQYGADQNVIAAGYLHDVPEDTKYNLEDIENTFGKDVMHLVDVACELDKTKSWEERKQHKIDKMRQKTLREKLVVIADKISNIEDLGRVFKENGKMDFSRFKRGKEKQEWYYRNIYESLVTNEDPNNPLYTRLENSINDVFGRTMEEYKNSIKQDELEK